MTGELYNNKYFIFLLQQLTDTSRSEGGAGQSQKHRWDCRGQPTAETTLPGKGTLLIFILIIIVQLYSDRNVSKAYERVTFSYLTVTGGDG